MVAQGGKGWEGFGADGDMEVSFQGERNVLKWIVIIVGQL